MKKQKTHPISSGRRRKGIGSGKTLAALAAMPRHRSLCFSAEFGGYKFSAEPNETAYEEIMVMFNDAIAYEVGKQREFSLAITEVLVSTSKRSFVY